MFKVEYYRESDIHSFYLDQWLANNLALIKKHVITQDNDATIILTGKTGAGKSVLAGQIAAFFNDKIQEATWVFNPAQFKKAVTNFPKYSVIIYDEAHNGFGTRTITQKENKELMSLMMECRYKNLFLILVSPEFSRLASELCLNRSVCLIEVFTHYDEKAQVLKRGFFNFYNNAAKTKAYFAAKKSGGILYHGYRKFWGIFSHHYVLPKDRYQQLKLEGLRVMHEKQKSIPEIKKEEVFKIKNPEEPSDISEGELTESISLNP